MRMPFLTTLLIIIFILTIQLKRTEGREEKIEEEFWERERKSNSVRKKNIDNLNYIPFDPEMLPLNIEVHDSEIKTYIDELGSLKDKRILNCTGKSNTDLKLEYGTANINALSEYDQNYTTLVHNIAFIAQYYFDNGYIAEAKMLLEYGISICTDVKLNYDLLGKIYCNEGNFEKIEELRQKASVLNSLSKGPIIRALDALMPV